jgi:hypothetical protein
MKKTPRKLFLSKETILNLQHRELRTVAGAGPWTQLTYCMTECNSCPQHSCEPCDTGICTESCNTICA